MCSLPPIRSLRSLICSLFLSATLTKADASLFREWQSNPETALLPDFSHAGYNHGNTILPDLGDLELPVFNVEAYGAIPDDDISDQPAIQRAIDEAALAGGGIVRFGTGVYRINDGDGSWSIMIRHSNIILQGAGSSETTLFSPKSMNRQMGPWTAYPMILVAAPELKGQELQYGYAEGQPPVTHDWYESKLEDSGSQTKEAGKFFHVREKDMISRLARDAARNERTVTLEDANAVAPGQRVVLVLRDRSAAEDLLAPWDHSRFPYLNWDGVDGYETSANLVRQILTVERVEGNQVTFKERLRWKYPVAQRAVVLRYPHIENVGVEGLKLKGVVQGGVPLTKTGLYFVNAANSWARDVKFINLKTALNITQSKNVTAVDCAMDGEGGKTGDYFEGFHNSMKFLSHSSDCLIERGKILRGVTHGFSCQRHANGNVFLDCEQQPTGTDGMNSRIDFHAQLPMANLYDNLKNGRLNGSGGNIRSQPHAGPLNVIWNWDSEINSEQTVWDGYGEFKLQLVRPIFVGLKGADDIEIQFSDGDRSVENEKVVTESTNSKVEPQSLYRAQVRERLGRGPGVGVYPFISGPAVIFSSGTYAWQAAGGGFSKRYYWNGSTRHGPKRIEGSPPQPGHHWLELGVSAGADEPMTTRKPVRILDRNGTLVDARAEGFLPVSRNVLRTTNGTLLQTLHTGQRFELDLVGDYPYFRSTRHEAEKNTSGSLMVTPLPAEGVDLSGYRYELAVENVARRPIRTRLSLAARDVNGHWAMSEGTLEWDTDSGTFDTVKWEAIDPNFGLPTGTFDSKKIDRIGFLMLHVDEMWMLKDNKLRFKAFRLANTSS